MRKRLGLSLHVMEAVDPLPDDLRENKTPRRGEKSTFHPQSKLGLLLPTLKPTIGLSRRMKSIARRITVAGEFPTSHPPSLATGRKPVEKVPKRATIMITVPQGNNRKYAGVMM